MILLSIVIPVYNEEKYLDNFLTDLLCKLEKLNWNYELILSENGSTDKTKLIAKRLTQKHQKIKLINLSKPNYGLAIKNGFLKARGKYLVLFDLDYYHIGFLRKSIKKMGGFDAVVASKLHGSSKDSRPWGRRVVTVGFSALLKILFRLKISDTHGIKILNRKKFLPIIKESCFTNEIFDTELLIRGQRKNLKLAEIGIEVKEKRASRTSVIKRSIKTISDLCSLKFKLLGEDIDEARFWKKIWLAMEILFTLVVGVEILKSSKTPAVIGEVHHQRQRQVEAGVKLFTGFGGKLVANRYLVASEEIKKRLLETLDFNIIFFAAHPNERAGIKEGERISWLFIPFFVWGLVNVIRDRQVWRKNVVFLWLAMSVIWAINFKKITDMALVGVIYWVWGVVVAGFYNLTRKIFK